MKKLIFLLVLLLCMHDTIPMQILMAMEFDGSEIANNPNMKDLLSFGAQYTVERGIQAGYFAASNYKLTRIYSVTSYLDEDASAKTYKFSVELLNSDGSIFYIIFEIFTLSESGIKYIDSYDYSDTNTQLFASLYHGNDLGQFDFLPMDLNPRVNELIFVPFEFKTLNGEDELFPENLGTDTSGWAHLDLSDLNQDPEMQPLINFGTREFLQREGDMGNLAGGQYHISHIYHLMRRLSKFETRLDQMDNSFEIELSNSVGPSVRANLVVPSRSPIGNGFELLEYTYMDDAYDANNFSDFELNTDEQAEYLQLNTLVIEDNPKIKEALDFSVNSITYGGIKISRLPEDHYDIIRINSIYVKGTNYRFDVELSNCIGLKVRAVCIVYLSEQEDPFELLSLYFRITDIPPEGLIGGTCTNN